MTDDRSERLRQKRHRRRHRLADPDEPREWGCGIGSCSYSAETVLDLVTHQARDHTAHTCKVCNKVVPDGFAAIYHAFEEHGRAEYVRAYGASAEEVRQREAVKAMVEDRIDVPRVLDDLTERYNNLQQ